MSVDDLKSEIQKLAPSGVIELFEVDLTSLGDTSYFFYAGTNENTASIVWQGQEYDPWAVQASGFDFSSNAQLPRPKLALANEGGRITLLILSFNDCVGAKVTRRRTMVKFLDAVNFVSGVNPDADPTAAFPDDVYYIDRKATENKRVVEFELTAAFDVSGVKLPRRQIIQNICPWAYRGEGCGYVGTDYFDTNDLPTSASQDVCGKRLTSCKARFGENSELPYGGFPGAGLLN